MLTAWMLSLLTTHQMRCVPWFKEHLHRALTVVAQSASAAQLHASAEMDPPGKREHCFTDPKSSNNQPGGQSALPSTGCNKPWILTAVPAATSNSGSVQHRSAIVALVTSQAPRALQRRESDHGCAGFAKIAHLNVLSRFHGDRPSDREIKRSSDQPSDQANERPSD